MLARKEKHIALENDYVTKIELLNELAKERIAFLATFKLPGIWQEDLQKIIDGETTTTTDGDGTTAGTVQGDGNPEKVWNFLAGKGLTPAAIAGIMGNLVQESGIDPKKKQQLGGGKIGRGRGLCQWETPGRWDTLLKYAKEKKKDEWDIVTQLEFMWKEITSKDIDRRMTNQGVDGFEGFIKLTDYKQATEVFEKAFERASKVMWDSRYSAAKKYYDKWGKNGPSKTTAKGGAKKVIESAESWLKKSTKYTWGGGRSKADIKVGHFDCSSFCRWAFAENGYDIMDNGLQLWGSTRTIIDNKKLKTIKTADLQPGDLVFFDTNRDYGHVTIYLGDNKCIGCQSTKAVSVIDMTSNYYKTRISKTHRRVF